jgi:hypothetical protein
MFDLAAATAILIIDADLGLLANITGREVETGLPTWVPDRSKPEITRFVHLYRLFEVGTGGSVQVKIFKYERQLRLRGYLIDTIGILGPLDSNGGPEVLTIWNSVCTQIAT